MHRTRHPTDDAVPIRRRTFLGASVAAATLAGCLDGVDETGDPETEPTDGPDEAPTEPPFPVETVDAPGSDAGTVHVPDEDRLTLVNFSRTTCFVSQGLIADLDEARQALESSRGLSVDDEDSPLGFLTVFDPTTGPAPSPEDVADWATEHGTRWPIGLDETGALTGYYDVSTFPTTVLVDGTGTERWRTVADVRASTIVSRVEAILDGEDVAGGDGADGADDGAIDADADDGAVDG